MKAVILGHGTVGRGVEMLCQQHPNFEVEKIYVRKGKERAPYFSSDESTLLDGADVVFECLNGIEPANRLIRLALSKSIPVISSNKAVMALYLDEYLTLAKENGCSVGIEACVAGGIPFMDALLKLQRLEPILGFEGIFNGTSNYILTNLQANGLAFEDALADAQNLGYAEADPTADIEGIDVANKTKLAIYTAFHAKADLPMIKGITAITPEMVAFARERGYIFRHVAKVEQDGDDLLAYVGLAAYPISHFFASIDQNNNGQWIKTASAGTLGYTGQGAGSLPTAQAMMQDALDLPDVKRIALHDCTVTTKPLICSCLCASATGFKIKTCSSDDPSVVALWRSGE